MPQELATGADSVRNKSLAIIHKSLKDLEETIKKLNDEKESKTEGLDDLEKELASVVIIYIYSFIRSSDLNK